MRWAVGLVVFATGCAPKHTVEEVAAIYHYDQPGVVTRHDPIVVIPGFLGSYLEDPQTNEIAWGRFLGDQRKPSDPEFARLIALPIADEDPSQLADELVATRVMRVAEIDVGRRTVKVNAYPGVLTAILLGEGDDGASKRRLTKTARETEDEKIPLLEEVAYDWRRDIVEAARNLDVHLDEALAVARAHRRSVGLPEDGARLDVVGHSTGCLVLRYYLRYGTAPLPEDGSIPEPTWAGAAKIRRAIFIGPPNLGSLSAFGAAAFGGRPESLLPNFPAPILGSFVSLYQLMPPVGVGGVVYEDGTPVDLYDAEVWARHGWGLFDERKAESLDAIMPEVADRPQRLGVARRYQQRVLARAEQFHRALASPAAPPAGTSVHLFASDSTPTPSRLVVDRKTGRPVRVQKRPGDGTVARWSALGDLAPTDSELTPLVSPIRWSSVHWVDGGHIDMIGRPDLIDNLLFLLFEQPVSGAPADPVADDASSGGPDATGPGGQPPG